MLSFPFMQENILCHIMSRTHVYIKQVIHCLMHFTLIRTALVVVITECLLD